MQTIKFTITPDVVSALRAFEPAAMMRVVQHGMDLGLGFVEAKIVKQRFTGRGPNSLGRVSGQASNSLKHSAPRIEGTTVIGETGSSLWYVKRHEFGFKGEENVRAHTRRGRPVRSHKRQINMPEKKMIRGGAADNVGEISNGFELAINQAMGR